MKPIDWIFMVGLVVLAIYSLLRPGPPDPPGTDPWDV